MGDRLWAIVHLQCKQAKKLILKNFQDEILFQNYLFINEYHLFIIFVIQIFWEIKKKLKMLKRQDTIERDVVVFEFTKNNPPKKPEPTVIEEVIMKNYMLWFITYDKHASNVQRYF